MKDDARRRRLEGIIIKRSDSVYGLGERSHNWIKLKFDHVDGMCDPIGKLHSRRPPDIRR